MKAGMTGGTEHMIWKRILKLNNYMAETNAKPERCMAKIHMKPGR